MCICTYYILMYTSMGGKRAMCQHTENLREQSIQTIRPVFVTTLYVSPSLFSYSFLPIISELIPPPLCVEVTLLFVVLAPCVFMGRDHEANRRSLPSQQLRSLTLSLLLSIVPSISARVVESIGIGGVKWNRLSEKG